MEKTLSRLRVCENTVCLKRKGNDLFGPRSPAEAPGGCQTCASASVFEGGTRS